MKNQKFNVGCGMRILPDYINCDLYPGEGVDAVFDIQEPWPFPEGIASEVHACHTLEHLTEPIAFMREAWRVLQPDGLLDMRMPYGSSRAAWWDLSHIRPWFAECFACFQPGYAHLIGNPQHGIHRERPWGIKIVQLRLGEKIAPYFRWRYCRRPLLKMVHWFFDWIEEMMVQMFPLKTEEDAKRYKENNHPAIVPVQFVVYKHHLEGRHYNPNEPLYLVPVGYGTTAAGWQ